eukprot:TRINITY_DN35985_c0_g1_i1.p1 TRINITY_DN35985_c0_g1~~TRINITY_DN35985_c0_g1_i1.p1  ORF type:complete len:879 (+),score=290.57 TRINITY_DN35985_c0_g1_i1:81-2717(+)
MVKKERLIPLDNEITFEEYRQSIFTHAHEGLASNGLATIDHSRSIRAYTGHLEKVLELGTADARDKNWDFACFYFYRYALVALQVQKHKDFGSLAAFEQQGLRKRAHACTAKCEQMNAELHQVYEVEIQRIRAETRRRTEQRLAELREYLEKTAEAETTSRWRLVGEQEAGWGEILSTEETYRPAARSPSPPRGGITAAVQGLLSAGPVSAPTPAPIADAHQPPPPLYNPFADIPAPAPAPEIPSVEPKLAQLRDRVDEVLRESQRQREEEEQGLQEIKQRVDQQHVLPPQPLPPPPGRTTPPPMPLPPVDDLLPLVAAAEEDCARPIDDARKLLDVCQATVQGKVKSAEGALQQAAAMAAEVQRVCDARAASVSSMGAGSSSTTQSVARRDALLRRLQGASQSAANAGELARLQLARMQEAGRAEAAQRQHAEQLERQRQQLQQELRAKKAAADRDARLAAERQKLEAELQQQRLLLQMQQQRHQQRPTSAPVLPAAQEMARLQGRLAMMQSSSRSSRRVSRPVPRWRFADARPTGRGQSRRGIVNLGNTCYMNSTLQALFATDLAVSFSTDLPLHDINLSNPLGFQGRIADAYRYIVKEMRSPVSFSISPSRFKQVIGARNDIFSGCSQQDANEFLRTLLGGLHDDLNKARQAKAKPVPDILDSPHKTDDQLAQESVRGYKINNDSVVDDVFGFVERSTLECPQCGHQARNFAVQQSLEVPIDTSRESSTLDDCLSKYTAAEQLDEGSKWTCAGCSRKVRAYKRLVLHNGPQVLVVTLKRFCSYGNLADKIRQPVLFPALLDIAPFVGEGGGQPQRYELVAVVNHDGGMGGGHYTCDAMGREDGRWWFFSDERLHQSTGEPNWRQAYLLFYRRVGR